MLKIVSVISIGLIILIVSLLAFNFKAAGSTLETECKAYIESAVSVLAKDWDPKELESLANKDLLALINRPDFSNMYSKYKKLGKMIHYEGAKGNVLPFNSGYDGVQASAQYIAIAKFENGDGALRIDLFKRNGVWEIASLHVDSPLFLQKLK